MITIAHEEGFRAVLVQECSTEQAVLTGVGNTGYRVALPNLHSGDANVLM